MDTFNDIEIPIANLQSDESINNIHDVLFENFYHKYENQIKEKRIQYYITRAEKELPLFDNLPASLMDI